MFDEDMSVFFDPAVFGTPATLDGVPVCVIFDDAYLAVGEVASTGPAAQLPSAAAEAVNEGVSTLVLVHPVSGQAATYTVHAAEPDGTGITLLRLRKG